MIKYLHEVQSYELKENASESIIIQTSREGV